MKSECPMGHTENLSHKELAERLQDGDFRCRVDGCRKPLSYEVDSRFWNSYVLRADSKPHIEENGRPY